MTIAIDNSNPSECCWDPPSLACCPHDRMPEVLFAELDGHQGCGHINHLAIQGQLLELKWDGVSKWIGTGSYYRDGEFYDIVYEFYCDDTVLEWYFQVVSCNGVSVPEVDGRLEMGYPADCSEDSFDIPSSEAAVLGTDCGCLISQVHEVDLNYVT